MDGWIDIREGLLAEALEVASPIELRMPGSLSDDLINVNVALLEGLLTYLNEIFEPCDHGVNICHCRMGAVISELTLCLMGRETCRACGGIGYVWDEEQYKLNRARMTEEQRWHDDESVGYRDCVVCSRQGTVSIEQKQEAANDKR